MIFLFIPFLWVLIKYFQHGIPDSSSFESWFFNSDSVLFYSLSKDIILNQGEIIDWYLPAAPSLFPTMFLIHFLSHIIKDIYFLNIAFLMAQLVLFYILLYFLIKYFTDKTYAYYFSFVIISLIVLILDFEPFLYYLKVDHHFGGFLNLLLCFILTINFLHISNKLIGIGLFSLLTIATISDPLILPHFSLPIIIVLYFFSENSQNNRSLVFWVIFLASILGYLLKQYFFENNISNVTLNYEGVINSMYHIKVFFTEISTISQNIIIFPLIYCLFKSGTILLKKQKGAITIKQLLILFVSFSFLTSITVFLFFPSNIQFRYLINIYYLSIITSIILLYPFINKIFNSNYSAISRIIYVSITLIAIIKSDWHERFSFSYYPSDVSYLDKIVNENKVEYGIADYWDANRLFILSKSEIKGIAPIKIDESNNGIIRKFITSELWRNKKFDFSYNINPEIIGVKFFDTFIRNNDTIYVFK